MTSSLREFSKKRLSGTHPIGVNICRKRFAQALILATGITPDKVKEIETVGKHKFDTALRDYLALSHEQEAEICRVAFIKVIGVPPGFPDEEAIVSADVGAFDDEGPAIEDEEGEVDEDDDDDEAEAESGSESVDAVLLYYDIIIVLYSYISIVVYSIIVT